MCDWNPRRREKGGGRKETFKEVFLTLKGFGLHWYVRLSKLKKYTLKIWAAHCVQSLC